MPRSRRSNKEEFNKRIEQVAILLSRFVSRQQILRFISEKTDWGVTERMVDKYIAAARDKLRGAVDKDLLRGQINKNLEILYRKNVDIEDYKEARSVLETIAKLYGIAAPQKNEATVKVEQPLFGADYQNE